MGSERRDIWTKHASLRSSVGVGGDGSQSQAVYRCSGWSGAVAMEARMTEMKSEPLNPLGKALVSLATA